jgi:RNA polymerase sigma-70 factor (TIGR02943 family)
MHDELTQWVNNYTNDLYKWALYKTSSVETAEDLVQDTFLSAAEKISSFKGDSAPKTWLMSILNHKIIDHYRKVIHKTTTIVSDPVSLFFDDNGNWNDSNKPTAWNSDETHLLDDADFQRVLNKCLDALPSNWNLCIKLKYLSGKNGDEICQELSISTTNFWQIVHRAKLQLRNCVESNRLNF